MKKIILSVILSLSFGLNAQLNQKRDSLRKILLTKKDTAEVNCLNALAREISSVSLDSSIYYADISYKKSRQLNYPLGEARALLLTAGAYRKKGKIDTATLIYNSVIEVAQKNDLVQELGESYMLQGFMLQNQGEYDKAMRYLIPAEKYFEQVNNKLFLGRNNWMLGNTYLKLGSYAESEKSFDKAKNYFGELRDSLGYYDCVLNTAIIYTETKKYSKALKNISESETYYRKVKHTGALSAALINQSEVLIETNNLNEAENVLSEALILKKAIGIPYGIASCLVNLGYVSFKKKEYEKSEKHYLEAIAIARQDNSLNSVLMAYKGMYEMLKDKKDFPSALSYHEKYMALNDSIYNSEKNKIIEEIKTKFETEKKDKALLKKDAELAKQEADSKQKSLQRNVLIVGFVLLLAFAVLIFKSLRRNKKTNKIITEQKQIVEEKQKEILDSIKYAERIQKALVTNEKYIQRNLNRLKKSGNN